MVHEAVGMTRRAALERREEHEAKELEAGGAVKVEPKPEEQVGRTSGDAQWREQRGELGANPAAKEQALALSDKGVAAVASTPSPVAASSSSFKKDATEENVHTPVVSPASKADTQTLFKAKFAEYVATGLSPNEAAVRALQEVKGSPGGPA